jgi:peptide deformylase
MAILSILHFPDPRLRNVAQPVETVDDDIRTLVDDMFDTMYSAPGIGLAAVQVNVPRQIIVIDISEERDSPLCLINPKILERQGRVETEEGCLSVPGIYETVQRSERVRVQALSQAGEPLTLETDGLLAICVQHEIDHLSGRLFVDYLSELKRQRIRKKAQKLARATM